MPDVGLMKMQDLESGFEKWVNTSSSKVRQAYGKWWYNRQQNMVDSMRHAGVDYVSVATDEDYVKALMALFKNRGVR